jgi:hypothetical protein
MIFPEFWEALVGDPVRRRVPAMVRHLELLLLRF